MKSTPGKIYDEDHAVCVLRWKRPRIVAWMLGFAVLTWMLGVATLAAGIYAGGPALLCWCGCAWNLARLMRLERKLKELEQ